MPQLLPISLRWMILKSTNSSSLTNPLLTMLWLTWRVSPQTTIHDFTNIFSKTHTCTLALHQPYNLKIKLEEGTSPPFSQIYSLSQSELKSLWEFLDKHLAMDFICPSWSLGGAPVLFACKKDGSLQLCIDFRGLNKITKKDQYPLPCITNLLNSLCKAKIYSKIDLRDAYHLVQIWEGDKWKTAFWTH